MFIFPANTIVFINVHYIHKLQNTTQCTQARCLFSRLIFKFLFDGLHILCCHLLCLFPKLQFINKNKKLIKKIKDVLEHHLN